MRLASELTCMRDLTRSKGKTTAAPAVYPTSADTARSAGDTVGAVSAALLAGWAAAAIVREVSPTLYCIRIHYPDMDRDLSLEILQLSISIPAVAVAVLCARLRCVCTTIVPSLRLGRRRHSCAFAALTAVQRF